MPKHYSDFVFRDGKLIGQFEEMYQHSDEVPWHQDKVETELNVRLGLEILRDLGPFQQIHEFGVGLGYFLRALNRVVGDEDTLLTGSDVSQTACNKAQELISSGRFWVEDLMKDEPVEGAVVREEVVGARLWALRGILWYVFPQLDRVIANISSYVAPGDILFVAQNFPPLDTDFVGKSAIPSPAFLEDLLSSHFKPIKTLTLEDHVKKVNDNWFLGIFTKKEE